MSTAIAEQYVKNKIQPSERKLIALTTVIVVGTGPVGVHFVRELQKREKTLRIVVFGDEPWQPYDRVKLSSLVAGDIDLEQIENPLHRKEGFLFQHHNCAITEINRPHKYVTDEIGRKHSYDKLVLAVGSSPHVPNIPGVHCRGVFTFRNLNDANKLMARTARSRSTVVIGGGLLGLEAAKAMTRNHTQVTVVQQGAWLMNKQLDEQGAALLQEYLEDHGIEVIVGKGVREILSNSALDEEKVHAVKLRDDQIIQCDTVVIAAGINPNTQLAKQCKLKIGAGILVDDHLKTNDDHIYAIGECVEHNQKIYGLVAPGMEQASVLAARIFGEDAVYSGSLNATQLKVTDRQVYSVGEVGEAESKRSHKTVVFEDKAKKIYRKIFLRGGRVVGAVGIGEWPVYARIRNAVVEQQRLYPWQTLRFRQHGWLWSDEAQQHVSDWPAAAIVCNCTGVTRGELSQAQQQGCITLQQLAQSTRASTVCGSCKPLLANISNTPYQMQEGGATDRRLIILCALAGILALLQIGLPPISNPDSVQVAFNPSKLWQDPLYKQISGFSLLGLGLISLLLSLRKRIQKFNFLNYSFWRLFHVALAFLCVLLLVAHTGLHMGENLNRLLMTNFILLAMAGAAVGVIIFFEGKYLGGSSLKALRRYGTLAHIILLWPVPVLLGFHILSVYYF